MDKFDQNLYEFVTLAENFEPAFEIANKFDFFKKRLIGSFWQKVIDNIELNIKHYDIPELNGWIASDKGIIKSPNILGIYNDEYCNESYHYPSVETCFLNWGEGRIIVGLFFNPEERIKGLDINKVRNYIKKTLLKNWKLAPLGYSLPIYKFMNDNFNTYETLRKMLPSEGDFLAKEYAQILINTHKELYPLIEKFGIKFK